jgi:hypothetical protein
LGEENPTRVWRKPREGQRNPPNHLESTLELQEMKWRRSEGVRVPRGMNPLYIPCSLSVEHVWLENLICLGGWICLVGRPDISGEFKLRDFRASGRICLAKGWTCLVIFGQKRLGNSRNLIIEGFGIWANSSTYILVIDGQVLKIKTHLAWNKKYHKTSINFSINRIFDIEAYPIME